ncbi:hypothetical protein B0T16DRAFT_421221 [Cercophora newfieldiana]|uniref:Zn(2)-C6 fungal-type domain-containing protein n=1 Tax=Cercophora newfieldiana TaxID=92897 RepID=A0AA39XQP7_9PEZI|nr:hypothetical protein B0T16DRAFT_421221 [Cercophora newfieldiana]
MKATTAMGDSGVSASRQKNCNACVQAKRRCDRKTPACSRCDEKQALCVYTKPRPGGHLLNSTQYPTPGDLRWAGPTYSPFGPDTAMFDVLPDLGPTTMSSFVTDMDTPNEVDVGLDLFVDFLNTERSVPLDRSLVPASEPPSPPLATPIDEEGLQAYEKMAPVCNRIKPWDVHDPSTALYYVMTAVRRFIETMASQNTTPFLHRCLYREYKPQSILSCFASCVLYANRTPENAAMVMQSLHRNTNELMETEGSGRLGLVTPIEKLARTQALFLYLVVRLFDGDVALRASGERDVDKLREWLAELCKIRDNLGGDVKEGNDSLEEEVDWERWIFAESLRRTILMAYSVMTMYGVLKGSEDKRDLDSWNFVHRWTLSRWLWEATSPSEFQRMWKEKPHFIITNYSFEHFLQCGRGKDVDEFAEILLSVYAGVEATKEFISADGKS